MTSEESYIWSKLHSTVEKRAKRTPDITVETTNEVELKTVLAYCKPKTGTKNVK